jgi:predicted porin
MKKTLIAIASFAALGAAQADVTLYGVIDAGFGSTSSGLSADANNPSNANILPSNAQQAASAIDGTQKPGRTTSMTNGMLQASRWGLKGDENLGGGLKANFVLESGLNIAGGTNPNDHALLSSSSSTNLTGAGDSSLNGQMFDRQASVGLAGDFGSVDVGFQLNLNGELMGAIDPFAGGYISPLGTYGGLTGMGSSYTGRASNSIKYATTMGNTTVKAFYAMGGYSGNAGQGSQAGLAAMIKATPTLDINVGASRMNDNVSFTSGVSGSYVQAQTGNGSSAVQTANTGAPFACGTSSTATASCTQNPIAGLTATYFNSTEAVLAAAWQATPVLKVNVGYISIVQSNASNGAADALIGQNNGIPIVATNTNTQPYATNKTTTVSFLGGTYDLTPTDHLKGGYYAYTRSAYTAGSDAYAVGGVPGKTLATASVSTAYGQSSAPIFAFVYDHDLSKKSDVYVAANMQKFDNGNQWATLYSDGTQKATSSGGNGLMGQTVSFIGAGLRVKF